MWEGETCREGMAVSAVDRAIVPMRTQAPCSVHFNEWERDMQSVMMAAGNLV